MDKISESSEWSSSRIQSTVLMIFIYHYVKLVAYMKKRKKRRKLN